MEADPSSSGGPRAEASYVSSDAVIARETAVVVRDLENRPGYWRPFVVRHVLVTLLFVGVLVVLTASGDADLAGLARGTAFALSVMAGLTALDLFVGKRKVRRAVRTHTEAACPPGTLVQAVWTPEWVLFRLPSHEIRVELATVTAARHGAGVLRLDQDGTGPGWVVPDELLGPDALAIVRDALGARLRESL